jgi:hypothetical protein
VRAVDELLLCLERQSWQLGYGQQDQVSGIRCTSVQVEVHVQIASGTPEPFSIIFE